MSGERHAPAAKAPPRSYFGQRGRWLAALLVLAMLALGLAWIVRDRAAPPAEVAQLRAGAGAARPLFDPLASAPAHLPLMAPAGRRGQLLAQLQLADQTYCRYRDSSKYPYSARPITEQRDQAYPNAPVTARNPMRLDGGASDPAVQIQSAQSRVFMAAGGNVTFSLRAVDGDGNVLPMVVTRALAQGLAFGGSRARAPVALAFSADGDSVDPLAGDGALVAVLAPSHSALASFDGTIRTEVRFNVAGRAGALLFDVVYSPAPPAVWSGQVRDTLDNGALNFYLKVDVRQAGRYIVTGRVDDARGKPVALLTFNDVLGAGPNEVRLTLFGKLMRDLAPALPLTLRDVDGYLLKENTDPDRALMPRLEGKIHLAGPYPLAAFSDAEWHSEERSRHLNEFANDVARARGALEQFDPDAALPKSACNAQPAANH